MIRDDGSAVRCRRGCRPWLLSSILAALLGVAVPGWPLAQTLTPGGQGQGTPTRITPSAGVPAYEVGCAGEQQGRPIIRCTISFESPAQVVGTRVVERGTNRDWTASFTAIDPTTDDSAFLFLVDRADPRRAATLAQVSRDLRDILGRTGQSQQIALATFGRSYTLLQPFTSDRQALQNAAGRIQPEGASRELYRFVREGARALEEVRARQRFLVVISDGQSQDTEFDRDEVEGILRRANIRFIGIGTVERESDRRNLQSLRRLAELPGGAFIETSAATRAIPADIRDTFTTRFTQGGTLNAEAPSTALPAGVEVTLRLTEGRSSSFSLETPAQAFGATPQPMRASPDGAGGGLLSNLGSLFDGDLAGRARDWVSANTGLAAGGAAALALVLAGLVVVLARRRPEPALAPAPDQPHAFPGGAFTAPSGPPIQVTPIQVTPIAPLGPGQETSPGASPPRVEEPERHQAMAYLEMNDAGRRRIAINRNFTTIGRLEGGNDIVLLDKNVSRNHAQLRVNDAGRWEIVNLTWDRPDDDGGRNPIAVNGQPVTRSRELRDGDVVRLGNLGDTQFTFRSAVEPAGRR